MEGRHSFAPPPRGPAAAGGEAAEENLSYGSGLFYRGRIFDLFILIEKDERLFIIDQHAAHERILFDRFLKGPIQKQELLVPIPFETESAGDDTFLESRRDELASLGLVIKKEKAHTWSIEALPANWKLDDRKTIEEILSLRTAQEDVARRWTATLACHAAVKDGDYLDEAAALALAKEALALPDPRCPHGRPIWSEISLEFLLKAVKRI